ncbi:MULTISPECIES: hypothetical protein [Bradyrhizobium]|nr:hypothetical protein [Bradyrhizobium elkanii]
MSCSALRRRSSITPATQRGWLWMHESGTYVKITPAGAELFT